MLEAYAFGMKQEENRLFKGETVKASASAKCQLSRDYTYDNHFTFMNNTIIYCAF